MTRFIPLGLVIGLLAVAPAIAQAPASPAAPSSPPGRVITASHVRVEIVSGSEAFTAGTHDLGITFVMDPGWHIYWINPGDSGNPPEVRWQLPEGVTAGPLEWPLPERMTDGGLVDYGYRNEVVLPVTLTISTPSSAGWPSLAATVRWLVCKDMCLAGSGTLALQASMSAVERARVPEWREAIARARRRVPGPCPANWRITASSARNDFTIDVISGSAESNVRFFPLVSSVVDDTTPPIVTSLPRGVRFVLRRSAQLVQNPRTLPGVVALNDGRAYSCEAVLAR